MRDGSHLLDAIVDRAQFGHGVVRRNRHAGRWCHCDCAGRLVDDDIALRIAHVVHVIRVVIRIRPDPYPGIEGRQHRHDDGFGAAHEFVELGAMHPGRGVDHQIVEHAGGDVPRLDAQFPVAVVAAGGDPGFTCFRWQALLTHFNERHNFSRPATFAGRWNQRNHPDPLEAQKWRP